MLEDSIDTNSLHDKVILRDIPRLKQGWNETRFLKASYIWQVMSVCEICSKTYMQSINYKTSLIPGLVRILRAN